MKKTTIILIGVSVIFVCFIFYMLIKQFSRKDNLNLMISPSSSSTNITNQGADDAILNQINQVINTSTDSQITTSTDKVFNNEANNTTTKPIIKTNVVSTTNPNQIKEQPPVVPLPPVEIKQPKEVMAWIYPGSPTCNAKAEYSTRKIDILKPEYFMINEDGKLVLLTEANNGCNGYSTTNVASIKKYSKEQYATISSSYSVSMDLFLTKAIEDQTDINTLVSFVVDNNLTGIEIDFEDFGGWTGAMYDRYKQFVTKLGNSLHEKHKKLMIDGPATSNAVEEAWYAWRYSDFNNLPVDRIVVMVYDYQYDQGVGQPVSPISWIKDIIKWTGGKVTNKTKLSIGVPSYGYKGTVGTSRFALLTYEQVKKEPGFSTAVRDLSSFEMSWQEGNTIYFYQDSESIAKKIQTIQQAGINSISIWHLGGNLWF